MSTVAEVEQKVCQHEQTNDNHLCVECGQYIMPTVRTGQAITYYDPSLADARKVIGFVTKINRTRRTISVNLPFSGGNFDLVRHVSDPKLHESPEHRENGAWDYSEESREMMRRFSDMEKRIADLEECLMSDTREQKPAKKKAE